MSSQVVERAPRPWGESLVWLWAVLGMQLATVNPWGVVLDHLALICRGDEHAACAKGRLRGWWWRIFAAQLLHACSGRAIWEHRWLGSLCDFATRSVFIAYGVAGVAACWAGLT